MLARVDDLLFFVDGAGIMRRCEGVEWWRQRRGSSGGRGQRRRVVRGGEGVEEWRREWRRKE